MCVYGVGLSSVQVPPSHHPSSLTPPPKLGYAPCCVGQWYALSPFLPSYGIPPPLCALVPGLLVGWLLVFGLLDWLLGWTAQFGWLVGWLVGYVVGWLWASCWGVCVCVAWTHAVWCCCTVCLCVSMHVQPLQGSLGGLCTLNLGVLAAF